METKTISRWASVSALLIAAWLALIPASAWASPPIELAPVGGALWRWMYEVEVSGSYAYCGMQFGLLVLDVREPQASTPVSHLYTPSGPVKGIAIQGELAYLAAGHVLVVDISNPAMPRIVSDVDINPFTATRICIDGGYAYVASPDPYGHLPPTHDGIVVKLDLTDPAHPTWVRTLSTPNNGVFMAEVVDLDVSGSRLVAAKTVSCPWSPMNPCSTQWPTRLEIVDVSVAESPSVVGWIPLSQPRGVTVAGDLALVPDQTAVRLIDISHPAQPVQVSWLAANPTDIAVVDQHAYVAGKQTLMVLNVSRPDSPSVSGRYDSLDAPWGVTVQDERAYVADLRLGLRVFDVANNTDPVPLGGWKQSAPGYRIAVSGDFAYAIGQDSSLRIIDVRNAESPTPMGAFATRGRPRDLIVQGGLAFIAEDKGGGMQIVDVSNPANPALVANYNGVRDAWGIDLAGAYAYLATYGSRTIQVIDISNPSVPVSRGAFAVPDFATGVRVQDGYAYVTFSGGLVIYRIDGPHWLQVLGRLDSLGTAVDVDVSGDYAYVADAGNGLRIVDVSNKEEPRIVATYVSTCWQCPFSVDGVQLAGDRVYVTSDRLHVLDVYDPVHPVSLFTFVTQANPAGLAVREPYVYASTDYGLLVLKVAQSTGIPGDGDFLPEFFALEANYPNPFNSGTAIRFSLDRQSEVNLMVYNILGQWVATPHAGSLPAGNHEVKWDGRTGHGGEAPSGLYFYRLTGGGQSQARKMLLLR